MRKPNQKKNHLLSRLDRIERKCDRVLSLLLVQTEHSRQSYTGDIIERLHSAARAMRVQCQEESRLIRRLYNSNTNES